MGRDLFGIMFSSYKVLSCLLLAGWIASTVSESEKTVLSAPGAWLKCFRDASCLLRKDLAASVKTHPFARLRRSADPPCPPNKTVTDEIAQDDFELLEYSPKDLRACLGEEVLKRNLDAISYYPFPDDRLPVLKEKLDQTGYPDPVLRNIGGFMYLMRPEDIKKWKLNSTETLASLLGAEGVLPEQAADIIAQYITSGGSLNGIDAKDICLLNPDQLKKIDENAIREAKPLNLSNCNQTTQDALYPIAKRAFSDKHNIPEYYKGIKPYLGGAPWEDLKALSKDKVNMDIDTFMKLRKDVIVKLTPSVVKGLLGRNLQDLKEQENNLCIKDWIVRQKQSELDKLGLGFTGGTPEGYINITPRYNSPSGKSGAPRSLTVHLVPSLLLTLLLTAFLS
ncbi:mesothelin isoform X1 [Sphaerodactylus townsendi]|uniref:mesothelin isoform X1 n=1 Tax=Sphaerodactylus townsendi TaxID=933632 RepID=UPI002026DA1C|nr:mesothelin isoform X1 [Sphaerodactylus townsendi]